MKAVQNQEIDFSSVDHANQRVTELTEAIRITRGDLTKAVREIREILYTKADDETITDLEDNLLAKLNEIAENINKTFAKKTETKIGFKNISSQIRDLYAILLSIPQDKTKGEEEDAMLSK